MFVTILLFFFFSFGSFFLIDGQTCPTFAASEPYAVVAFSTITNTGETSVTGDIALSPGVSITGFPPGIVIGTTSLTNNVAGEAQTDIRRVFNCLMNLIPVPTMLHSEIGGSVLAPGIYTTQSSLSIAVGDLTLDGGGDPNSYWVFQIPSSLILQTSLQVVLAGGAEPGNVYWAVGSSATFQVNSIMVGNVIAQVSIKMKTSNQLAGRAFSLGGAVTLDTNTVIAPSCSVDICTVVPPAGGTTGASDGGPPGAPTQGAGGAPSGAAAGSPTGAPSGAASGGSPSGGSPSGGSPSGGAPSGAGTPSVQPNGPCQQDNNDNGNGNGNGNINKQGKNKGKHNGKYGHGW